MNHTTPLPGDRAPTLRFQVLGGAAFDLSDAKPEAFTAIFFYRGVHCPICKSQLEELSGKLEAFRVLGVEVYAISMGSPERAERQANEWNVGALPIGYGLSEESARDWGLFISAKAKDTEPDRFAEPGFAVVYPDGRIYALHLQNVPFARPCLDDLLEGLKFVIANDYPVRGSVPATD
ncbi:thioredoxin peroxidase [Aureimonas sp. SA4125]|uniref:redoxin domain-containing protein n=1 Tax=Aureimonas sp. SA4125 TaxID=2826993 RepID=UPI001CC3D15B|nr:redoxin domain-containing protein [Aureimonas sp. SA4125]BDA82509.1 thioredoxin peroxidase [Aureimonas sp. SA4125]